MTQSKLVYPSSVFHSPLGVQRHDKAALEEALALKDLFFSIITHDLKGPLGMLRESLDYVREHQENFSKDDLLEMLSGADEAARECTNLLNNLLCWHQEQKNQLEYRLERLSLQEIFGAQEGFFTHQALRGRVELTFECHGVDFVLYDAQVLSLILRNLIGNALKFTPAGGQIRVEAIKSEGFVEICVRDNGRGIPQADQDLLNQCISLQEHKNRAGVHSGLGLRLCRDFVEKLGGIFWFESQAGKGSCFSFMIPE